MSKLSAQSPQDSGYPNAVTLRVWNRFYRKRIFAGSLSTHTGCCLEKRARPALSSLPATPQQDRPRSHAIPTPAAKSGVHKEATQELQFTGNFIATLVSICQ